MNIPLKIYLVGFLLFFQCCLCNEPFTQQGSTANRASQAVETNRIPHTPPARVFLVVFDSSKSYKDHEAALLGLLTAIKNLGPGDRLVLARISERLNPKNFMIVDGEWWANKPDENTFKPTKNIQEWRIRQQRLDAAWQEAENSSQKLAATLEREKTMNTAALTDLHGALEYSVLWLNEQPGLEKTLIVCSDLENDTGKPTFAPPVKSLDASKVNVKLLFVTYGDADHWSRIEPAWRTYFRGAASFAMLDSGRAATAMIAPSTTPRKLDHPFLTRSD